VDIFSDTEWGRVFGVARGARLGPRVGSVQLGATLYELDPGGQAAPYHFHHANEELLIVLDGELELRTPEGLRTIRRGEVVGFVAGESGAHRVRNAGSGSARYLVVSTQRWPEVAEYPDTGTVLAMKGSGDGWAFAEGAAGDYVELLTAALEADSGSSERS
jgi:uncharacterized cupin superfamily protein